MTTFGVEIEFVLNGMTGRQIADAITEAGVVCHSEDYNHQTREHWKLTTDASCGWELVSPVLDPRDGDRCWEEIAICCGVLTGLRAQARRNCGLHVHLGMEDRPIREVAAFVARYIRLEHLFDWMMPVSRRYQGPQFVRTNVQCRYHGWANITENPENYMTVANQIIAELNTANTMQEVHMIACIDDRYKKINTTVYNRFCNVAQRDVRTIEVRHHSGTINAEKICKWVRLLMSLLRESDRSTYVRPLTTVQVTHDLFCRTLYRLDDRPAAVYAMERAREFMVRQGIPVRPTRRHRGTTSPRATDATPDFAQPDQPTGGDLHALGNLIAESVDAASRVAEGSQRLGEPSPGPEPMPDEPQPPSDSLSETSGTSEQPNPLEDLRSFSRGARALGRTFATQLNRDFNMSVLGDSMSAGSRNGGRLGWMEPILSNLHRPLGPSTEEACRTRIDQFVRYPNQLYSVASMFVEEVLPYIVLSVAYLCDGVLPMPETPSDYRVLCDVCSATGVWFSYSSNGSRITVNRPLSGGHTLRSTLSPNAIALTADQVYLDEEYENLEHLRRSVGGVLPIPTSTNFNSFQRLVTRLRLRLTNFDHTGISYSESVEPLSGRPVDMSVVDEVGTIDPAIFAQSRSRITARLLDQSQQIPRFISHPRERRSAWPTAAEVFGVDEAAHLESFERTYRAPLEPLAPVELHWRSRQAVDRFMARHTQEMSGRDWVELQDFGQPARNEALRRLVSRFNAMLPVPSTEYWRLWVTSTAAENGWNVRVRNGMYRFTPGTHEIP